MKGKISFFKNIDVNCDKKLKKYIEIFLNLKFNYVNSGND